MTGLQALRQGLQAARRGWRYVVYAWLLDLVVAALVALPFVLALDGAAAATGGGAALAARFDERFFAEFAATQPALHAHWDLRLALCTAAAVLLHAFCAGGLIEVLARRGARGEPGPVTVRIFLVTCVEHASRMIAISVLAGLLLALLGALLHGLIGGRMEGWLADVPRERTRLLLTLAPGVAYLLLLAVVATWADLARACVVLGEREVLPALGRGARILGRRAGALGVMGLAALALQLAALVAFVGCDAVVPQGRWGGILLVIVAAQGLMLWRHGVRVAVIAATARLCRDDLAARASRPTVGDEVIAEVAAPETP
ncbi:MAG: hypothetical protein HY906_17355 [Deltaproteobacteria bacterium]|nr:hypothetical protein [Deltaproteobacteria bacterium]